MLEYPATEAEGDPPKKNINTMQMKSEPEEKLDGDPPKQKIGSSENNEITLDIIEEPERNGGPSEKKTDSLEKYSHQQPKQNSVSLNEYDPLLKRADPSVQRALPRNTNSSETDFDALHKSIGILIKQGESINLDTAPRQQNIEYSPRGVAGPPKQDNGSVPPQSFFKRLFGTSTREPKRSGIKVSKAQSESKGTNIEISAIQKVIGIFGYSSLTPEDIFSPVMRKNQANTRNFVSSKYNDPRQENSPPSFFKRILSLRKSNGTVAEGNKSGEHGVSSNKSGFANQENNPTSTKHSSSQKSLESNGSSTTSGSSRYTEAVSELPFTDRSTQVSNPSTFYNTQWREVSDTQVASYVYQLSHNPVWMTYFNDPTIKSYYTAVQFIRLYFSVELVDKMLTCHSYHSETPVMIFNAGYECYGIAAIHALFACKPLNRYLKDKKTETPFDHALRVLYAMYKFNWDHITITPLLRNMGYNFYSQEDSEEFVRKFAERCYKDEFGKVNYQQTLKCLRCSEVSASDHENVRISLDRSDSKALRSGTIQQLINETAENSVVDRTCKFCRYNKSTQSLAYVLPTIITLHLNTLFKRNTVDDITFQTVVDFAPLVKSQEPKLYKLGGVVYYKQLTEDMGHYFARVQYGNDSYIFDETKIKRNGRVTYGTPYYAFYYGAEE